MTTVRHLREMPCAINTFAEKKTEGSKREEGGRVSRILNKIWWPTARKPGSGEAITHGDTELTFGRGSRERRKDGNLKKDDRRTSEIA